MARQPRLTLAGYAHHVVQRGNDRQLIVRDDADRERLLTLWRESAKTYRVAVHAWVILDNHFHLLLTPQTEQGVAQMMQAVGRAYVRYFNTRYHRSGTLWEGRFRSNLLESERFLLPCMIYMDLNPVRLGLVSEPGEYLWSSHRYCIGQVSDPLLTPHALFWGLGNTPFAREAAYAERVQKGLASSEVQRLSQSVSSGWPLGSSQFIAQLALLTPRRLVPGKAGRPFKTSSQ